MIRQGEAEQELTTMRWGIPAGPDGAPEGSVAVEDLQGEGAAEERLASRRCVVPVTGWYEGQRVMGRGTVPHLIEDRDGGTLHLAGVWEPAGNAGGLPLFQLLSRRPGLQVAAIHHRRPAMLGSQDEIQEWLQPDTARVRLLELARWAGPSRFRIQRLAVPRTEVTAPYFDPGD